MIKYTVWCRWSQLAGHVPDTKDKEWNLVPAQTNLNPYQWGYLTYEAAEKRAANFVQSWQEGFMETTIVEVELPD